MWKDEVSSSSLAPGPPEGDDEVTKRASVFLSSMVASTRKRVPEVMPGDDVTEYIKQHNDSQNVVQLGHGLVRDDGGSIVATAAGTVKFRSPGNYWVDDFSRATHYYPRAGDQVVGIIEDRGGDWYKVNIGCGCSALLNRLSFEGASKRNKPEMERGDVAYMRVAAAHRDMDVELTCVSASGVKKDWSSGECIYGPLAEGLLLRVSLQQAKVLLRPDCALLNTLGKHVPFEIAVGMNGIVWFKAGGVLDAIILRNTLANAEGLDDLHTEAMVLQLLRRARSSRQPC